MSAPARAAVQPQRLEEGIFAVEYWPGDEQIARDSLNTLQQTLSEFADRLPNDGRPVSVTICRSLQEFQKRAGQYGRAWVGGVSRAPSGLIAVKAPYLLPDPADYEGLLRHELLHVLLARNSEEAWLPRWLNEGTVMVLSKENRWGSMARVARMYLTRRLIPYHNLDFAFLPLGDEVLSSDAYAQALSMTQFLMHRVGEEGFWKLFGAMREQPFETALREATGLSPGQFYNAWRHSMWLPAVVIAAGSAFSAFNLMVVLAVLAWFRKRRRNAVIVQQWADEERADEAWENEHVSPDPWDEGE